MSICLLRLKKTLVICAVSCLVLAACAIPSEPGTPAAPADVTAEPTPGALAETPAPSAATPAPATLATNTPTPEAAPAGAASPLPTPAAGGPGPAPEAAGAVPFEIVAQEAALVGQGTDPITLALRGDDPNPAIPDLLPDAAREALQNALARSEPALFIVVYAGVQPSSGYQANIEAIKADGEKLVVEYSLQSPRPDQGGANVRTHPFVIARVDNTRAQPGDVVFNRR